MTFLPYITDGIISDARAPLPACIPSDYHNIAVAQY